MPQRILQPRLERLESLPIVLGFLHVLQQQSRLQWYLPDKCSGDVWRGVELISLRDSNEVKRESGERYKMATGYGRQQSWKLEWLRCSLLGASVGQSQVRGRWTGIRDHWCCCC